MIVPFISIIIPVYQADKYLPSCLESCINQTFTNFEIIAVNDGCTDRSQQILEYYSVKDQRLKVIMQENRGLVAARKTGIQVARGKYLYFVDSDDTISCNALELLCVEAQNSKSDYIIGDMNLYNDNGKLITIITNNVPSVYFDSVELISCILSKKLISSLCGRLIRRECFSNLNTPEDITIGEDFISNLLMFENRKIILAVINIPLYNYIQHKESMIHFKSDSRTKARIKFINWVVSFVNERFSDNELVLNSLALFVLEEYFTFLRDGGSPKYDENVTNLVNYKYLENDWAVCHLASWRLFMLRCYKRSIILGGLYRSFLLGMRHLFNR
ncbi:glycosyltransferase family 2 protein [Bacteroides sp.]|uniref:glycosyltransferase family 2 protein n=1 Tax=Bacteroides TaxID=816 RepID=UPI00307ABC23|nr:glycosyltransferase [Bacteroides fragilis]MCS3205322.1 glycosyltransferase [Bacteroides fragilis]